MSSTRTALPDSALADLLSRAADGDVRAFGELYDATCAAAWRLELCRHGDRAAAAEAVRRRYATAWRHAAAQPASGRSPQGWLLGLVPDREAS
ncbi:hypothetical protein ACIRN4_00110 [Pimelobacter simplex]|uniref:Uncharacterized protein n=1 Tax=Nocardioides simplex TaxID=2045 RepID=A0A7J5E269_NOCSI|nr:hypothetical protein [Pimelobacter simplex]KAB2812283.1 hypothetical protein F9L07_10835 [Pimelobacter simplex]